MIELARKVALVTGGSRGIGRAVVRALAARDCHVIINYHSHQDAAERLRDEVDQAGGRASIARADVAEFTAVQDMIRATREEFGRLDVLVNCAGILEERLFFFMDMASFWRVLQVNLGGTANTCKAASALLGKHKAGRVINLSSIAASHGTTGLSAYACSKAAVEALTRVLARELASAGIRVNAIAPGLVATDMTESMRSAETRDRAIAQQPIARIGQPEEVASLVTYLALDAPDYLTGEIIRLDGGAAIA